MRAAICSGDKSNNNELDKPSSAELSEAINSMFHWYQKAARCYVYLSDVSISKRKASDMSAECTWESAFRASKWFTRGWTLQELLAPKSVEFFSREGKCLGNKRTLEQKIHEMTGIPESDCQPQPSWVWDIINPKDNFSGCKKYVDKSPGCLPHISPYIVRLRHSEINRARAEERSRRS